LQRPHRPYTFTQLVTLSDGSTYLHRTTSPLPVFRSTKDTRNTPLWQPSMAALRNVEADEAGRLRAFRKKFGRGWDTETPEGEEESSSLASSLDIESNSISSSSSNTEARGQEQGDSLMDLISSGYGSTVQSQTNPKTAAPEDGASVGGEEVKKRIKIMNRETGRLEIAELTVIGRRAAKRLAAEKEQDKDA